MNLMVHKHVIFMVIAGESTLYGTADSLTTQSEYRNLQFGARQLPYNIMEQPVLSFYFYIVLFTSRSLFT